MHSGQIQQIIEDAMRQGSTPGRVGEGALQRKCSISVQVPVAYSAGVLRKQKCIKKDAQNNRNGAPKGPRAGGNGVVATRVVTLKKQQRGRHNDAKNNP